MLTTQVHTIKVEQDPWDQFLAGDVFDQHFLFNSNVSYVNFHPAKWNPTTVGFPSLQSKAAASKILTFWLATRANKFAERPGATQADKVMASCMFAYMMMLRLMDAGGLIFTQDQAVAFNHFALKHLQCYVWLHSYGMTAPLNTPGRKCWLLLPKLHHMWHLAHDTLKVRINPKMVMLLSAESFIGIMGRISRATHRSTVSKRTLERYLVQLNFKLKTLEKPWGKVLIILYITWRHCPHTTP